MVLPINSPILKDPIDNGDYGNGDYNDDGWGTGHGGRPRPPEDSGGFEDFQVEIPDWLKRFSEEGYGAGFMRDVLQVGGTPLASRANVMQRQLAENPFLQGVSGSGFAAKKIESLGVEKSKQLSSLQLGVESKNLQVQQGALSRLRDLERFNEQIERDFRNMGQVERMQAMQRKHQLQAALNAYDQQQGPSGGEQIGSFLLSLGPGLLAGL